MINDANNIVLAVVGLPLELLFALKRDTLHEALLYSHCHMTPHFSLLTSSWEPLATESRPPSIPSFRNPSSNQDALSV